MGNETSRNGTSLQFDQKNQLLQIPGVDSCQYDAAGRRTVKTSISGGTSSYTFYNHAGQLLYQLDPSTSQATDFIYLGTRMIARNALLHLAAAGADNYRDRGCASLYANRGHPGGGSQMPSLAFRGSAKAGASLSVARSPPLNHLVDSHAWRSGSRSSRLAIPGIWTVLPPWRASRRCNQRRADWRGLACHASIQVSGLLWVPSMRL